MTKVAIVHYWLVGMRGGEKVLESLCDMYPEADIFTHVYVPERISQRINSHKVRTTFINRLPFASRLYQNYLMLMPMALEQLDLRAYDLVISSESGPAKGVITHPGTLHVCYCHTPMRYLWSGYHEYMGYARPALRMLMPLAVHLLRQWDSLSASRVDHFIANSSVVADRVKRYYGRDSHVIHPPVDTDGFSISPDVEDFYLFVSQLVPYKRADIAVKAFNRLGRRLVVIGDGSERKRLAKMAGPNIHLVGSADENNLRRLYSTCRALVFLAEEDFGIVPVEAMASGRPVIAYGRGGALETVKPGISGIHFAEQTEDSLIEAIRHFEAIEEIFEPRKIREHALQFSQRRFTDEFRILIDQWSNKSQPVSRPIAIGGKPAARLAT
jgi:glycosyltransferase involved in cell wall biosynthesis